MGDNRQQGTGRKPRNYYVDYTKKKYYNNRGKDQSGANKSKYSYTPDISFGNRGFLITSIDEVKSYLEIRNLLEEHFETLYKNDDTKQDNDNDKKKVDSTVEDELESELKQLRLRRPFKQVKTKCRNTLFINIVREFEHVDPILVTDKLFDDLNEKRQLRTTNTYKVLPILDTFRNSLSCARESVTKILQNILNSEDDHKRTYFIEFQSRGNHKLSSEDKQNWIEGVATRITDLRPNWKVDRENADYIIVLVALKEVCCITFLKDYFKRSKYNIVEFCKEFEPNHESAAVDQNTEVETKINEDVDKEGGEK